MLAICVLIALCIAVLVCFKGEPPRIASCLLLALVVAFPAQAGPLSKVREKIGGILHRNSSSSSSTTTTTSQSRSDCPCNSTICTGQPGCPCSNGNCTCNSPTAVMKQDAPAAPRKLHRVLRQPKTSKAPAESDEAPKTPAEKPAKTAAPTDGASLNPDEQRILVAINNLRASHGKPPVVADPLLMKVARERVDDLQNGNPHMSNKYGWAPQHAARYAKWVAVNDVVAASHWSDGSVASPESSVDGWRQSDGHLRCILGQSNMNNRWIDQGYDRVGVARGRRFDIAVFGRRS